jgi:hypothetical protein
MTRKPEQTAVVLSQLFLERKDTSYPISISQKMLQTIIGGPVDSDYLILMTAFLDTEFQLKLFKSVQYGVSINYVVLEHSKLINNSVSLSDLESVLETLEP